MYDLEGNEDLEAIEIAWKSLVRSLLNKFHLPMGYFSWAVDLGPWVGHSLEAFENSREFYNASIGHHNVWMKLFAFSAQGCISAMCVTVLLYKEFSFPKCQAHPHWKTS